MHKTTYFAVFEPTNNGFSVYFPDLPGCISCGDDYSKAFQNAKEALGLHLYAMEKDGDSIPKPSQNSKPEKDTAPGYFISPISIYPELVKDDLDNKAVKTNITLPQWLKDWATEEGINLSQTLQSTLRGMYNTSEKNNSTQNLSS